MFADQNYILCAKFNSLITDLNIAHHNRNEKACNIIEHELEGLLFVLRSLGYGYCVNEDSLAVEVVALGDANVCNIVDIL